MQGSNARFGRDGIVGVVLAGGLSRRMGGGDKGLLDVAGQPMIAHVVKRLAPQVDRIVINANGEPARFAALGLPIVADTLDGYAGPLAGVLAGMCWTAAELPAARHVATVSADAPLIPYDLVVRLAAALDGVPADTIAIARSAGRMHPVIGLWPVALAETLQAALEAGERKVLAWIERRASVAVEFACVEIGRERIDPFLNANTPEDIAEIRRIAAIN